MNALLRDSAIYFVPTLLARGLGLMLLPLYTRYLGPAEYGTAEMLTVLFALLHLVLPLDVGQAVARFSVDAESAAQRGRYFSTAFWFTALTFGIWLAITLAFPQPLGRMLLGSQTDGGLLPFAAAAMLANALLLLALNQLRWNMQPKAYAAVNMLFALTAAAVSVVLVVGFDFAVYGIVWGQLAGSLTGLGCAAALLSRTSPLCPTFSWDELRALVAYSAPLVVSGMAIYLAGYADRWIVSAFLGMEALGLYAVPARLASIITLFSTSLQLALSPWIFSHYREPGTPTAIRRVFQYYLLAMFTIIAAASAGSGRLIAWVAGDAFLPASGLVAPILVATLLASLYVFAPGPALVKRTGLLARANLAGAAVSIAGSLLMVPSLGMMGAALGMLAGAATMSALKFLASQACYPVPYRWGRYAAAFCALSFALLLEVFPLSTASKMVLLLVSFAAFAWLLIGNDVRHALRHAEAR